MLRTQSGSEKIQDGDSAADGSLEIGLASRSAMVLDSLVFCGLLALIVTTAIPYGTVDPWWEAVFECAVFALTSVWIVEALLRGSWQIKKLSLLLPLIVMTAYAFLQTVQIPAWSYKAANGTLQDSLTIDPYQTHLTAVKMLALTLFTALLLLHVSNRRRLQWTVWTILGLALGSTVFGIMRQMLQSPDATTGFILPFLFPGVGYAQFISPNVFAFLVEMAFGLVSGLVLGAGLRRQHILIYVAVGFMIWAGLVLSNSRGAFVGFACQAIFLLFVGLAWLSSRRLNRGAEGQRKLFAFIHSSVLIRVIIILAIVATLLVGVLWMGGDRLASKVNEQNSPDVATDGTTRKEIWKSTWQLIKQNPWTGVGFGAYFLAIAQYEDSSGKTKVEQAHNDYLDLAAGGGLVAVVLAALFIAVLIGRARSSLRSPDPFRRAASLGAIAGILSVGVHSFVDFGLQLTGIAVVFATLFVIVVADINVAPVISGPAKILFQSKLGIKRISE